MELLSSLVQSGPAALSKAPLLPEIAKASLALHRSPLLFRWPLPLAFKPESKSSSNSLLRHARRLPVAGVFERLRGTGEFVEGELEDR
jgi:hypothetical protein